MGWQRAQQDHQHRQPERAGSRSKAQAAATLALNALRSANRETQALDPVDVVMGLYKGEWLEMLALISTVGAWTDSLAQSIEDAQETAGRIAADTQRDHPGQADIEPGHGIHLGSTE